MSLTSNSLSALSFKDVLLFDQFSLGSCIAQQRLVSLQPSHQLDGYIGTKVQVLLSLSNIYTIEVITTRLL